MLNKKLSKPFRNQRSFPAGAGGQGINVVRQTISKWGARPVRPGLRSADRPVGGPGGACRHPAGRDSGSESEADEVKALSEKLEIINLQFARRKAMRRAALHWLLIAVCGASWPSPRSWPRLLRRGGEPRNGGGEQAIQGWVVLVPFALFSGRGWWLSAEKEKKV